MNKHISKQK